MSDIDFERVRPAIRAFRAAVDRCAVRLATIEAACPTERQSRSELRLAILQRLLSRGAILKDVANREPGHPGRAWLRRDATVGLTDGRPSVTGIDEERRAVACVISTAARDRMGDIVEPQGCDISDYSRNPVVCWGHQHQSIAIARAADEQGRCTVRVESDRVTAVAFFDPDEPESERVFQAIVAGRVNAVSIGFDPGASERASDPKTGRAGYRFTRWKLLDFSFFGISESEMPRRRSTGRTP